MLTPLVGVDSLVPPEVLSPARQSSSLTLTVLTKFDEGEELCDGDDKADLTPLPIPRVDFL
jgi:hypothetical protein